MDLGPEHFHPVDVEPLSLHVFAAHVDLSVQTESCAGNRSGDPVLSCSGLGYDPALAHFLCEQSLSESIVDLVGSTMQQILSFQVNLSTLRMTTQIGSEIQRRRSSSETLQPSRQFFLEQGVARESVVGFLKRSQRFHQGLRDILPSVLSKLARRRTRTRVRTFLQALTSSLTFPSMLGDFITEVPTRKASAPAAFSRLMSCGDSIPLSETTSPSRSTFSVRMLSVVDKSSLNVDKFRLLIP